MKSVLNVIVIDFTSWVTLDVCLTLCGGMWRLKFVWQFFKDYMI